MLISNVIHEDDDSEVNIRIAEVKDQQMDVIHKTVELECDFLFIK